jgi:hypothetical protein
MRKFLNDLWKWVKIDFRKTFTPCGALPPHLPTFRNFDSHNDDRHGHLTDHKLPTTIPQISPDDLPIPNFQSEKNTLNGCEKN